MTASRKAVAGRRWEGGGSSGGERVQLEFVLLMVEAESVVVTGGVVSGSGGQIYISNIFSAMKDTISILYDRRLTEVCIFLNYRKYIGTIFDNI